MKTHLQSIWKMVLTLLSPLGSGSRHPIEAGVGIGDELPAAGAGVQVHLERGRRRGAGAGLWQLPVIV